MAKKPPETPNRRRFAAAVRACSEWARANALMIVVAINAFAGSFGHIVALAALHGQLGWHAFTTAGCFDAISIIAAEERQRDKRIHRDRVGILGFPSVVLYGSIIASLLAQLATVGPAQQNAWGWNLACTPTIALLIVLTFMERRAAYELRNRAATPEPAAEPAAPATKNQAGTGSQNQAPSGSGTGSARPAKTGSGGPGGDSARRQTGGTSPPPVWLPEPLGDRWRIQSAENRVDLVRKIDAEFRTHNKGRAISGQYLAAVLQCHKSEALTLLDEAFPDRAKRRADAIAAREEASG